jgi:hypothetical protein
VGGGTKRESAFGRVPKGEQGGEEGRVRVQQGGWDRPRGRRRRRAGRRAVLGMHARPLGCPAGVGRRRALRARAGRGLSWGQGRYSEREEVSRAGASSMSSEVAREIERGEGRRPEGLASEALVEEVSLVARQGTALPSYGAGSTTVRLARSSVYSRRGGRVVKPARACKAASSPDWALNPRRGC